MQMSRLLERSCFSAPDPVASRANRSVRSSASWTNLFLVALAPLLYGTIRGQPMMVRHRNSLVGDLLDPHGGLVDEHEVNPSRIDELG